MLINPVLNPMNRVRIDRVIFQNMQLNIERKYKHFSYSKQSKYPQSFAKIYFSQSTSCVFLVSLAPSFEYNAPILYKIQLSSNRISLCVLSSL
jgi:hypothetical protein